MQSMNLDLKNNLVKLQGEKFMLDANVNDYKRLVMMQNKLNNSLQHYYDRRSRDNENSLNLFKLRTNVSCCSIKTWNVNYAPFKSIILKILFHLSMPKISFLLLIPKYYKILACVL